MFRFISTSITGYPIKTKMPMFEISKVIQRDYLGVIRSKTPVHVLKESKV